MWKRCLWENWEVTWLVSSIPSPRSMLSRCTFGSNCGLKSFPRWCCQVTNAFLWVVSLFAAPIKLHQVGWKTLARSHVCSDYSRDSIQSGSSLGSGWATRGHSVGLKSCILSCCSTIQAWLVDDCRDDCLSGRFSSPHRGSLEVTKWPSGSWSPRLTKALLPRLLSLW